MGHVGGLPGAPGYPRHAHHPPHVSYSDDYYDVAVKSPTLARGSAKDFMFEQLPPPPPPPLPDIMATFISQTEIPHTSPSTVRDVRFLISAQPKQICYDVPVGHKLRLLLDHSSDLSINGQLSAEGFQLIAIHYKTAELVVSPAKTVYTDRQDTVTFVWGQPDPNSHESDSVSIFLRGNELDVTMGTVRVVFLLHKKAGDVFLWPVVHQQPENIQGILGKTNLQYEELPGSKLKIKDLEVEASRSSAIDYRFPAAPTVECRLVPFQSALQGELSDFTVSQL